MHPCLDVSPVDFGWAREETASGRFVFVVQGDPRVSVPMWEGMGWVRKDIVPQGLQGSFVYDVDGQGAVIPAITLPAFMRDVGVDHFYRMRLSGQHAQALLAELPGPVAREIVCRPVPEAVVEHLMDWYTMGLTGIRRNPLAQELTAKFTLRTAR